MCRRGTMIVFPKMRYPPSDLRLLAAAPASGQRSTHAAGAHRVELLWTLRDVEVRKGCCAGDQWLERGRERETETQQRIAKLGKYSQRFNSGGTRAVSVSSVEKRLTLASGAAAVPQEGLPAHCCCRVNLRVGALFSSLRRILVWRMDETPISHLPHLALQPKPDLKVQCSQVTPSQDGYPGYILLPRSIPAQSPTLCELCASTKRVTS